MSPMCVYIYFIFIPECIELSGIESNEMANGVYYRDNNLKPCGEEACDPLSKKPQYRHLDGIMYIYYTFGWFGGPELCSIDEQNVYFRSSRPSDAFYERSPYFYRGGWQFSYKKITRSLTVKISRIDCPGMIVIICKKDRSNGVVKN